MVVVIPLLFLFASVYALCNAVVLRSTRLHGCGSYAKVEKVEHIIPFGLRRSLSRRDGSVGCDYIVYVTFPTKEGNSVGVRATVHARLKLVNDKRIPFFSEGDRIPIQYHPRFQKVVYFNVEPVRNRQGALAPIVVWGCCTVVLTCIVSYMLFA
jgi:hypothetical protein